MIYDSNVLNAEKNFLGFPRNVNTVFFKFGDHVDTRLNDKHLKSIPAARYIELDIGYHNSEEDRPQVSESRIRPYSLVKHLYVKQHDKQPDSFKM